MSMSTHPVLGQKAFDSGELKQAANDFIDQAADESKKIVKKAVNDTIDCATDSLESLQGK